MIQAAFRDETRWLRLASLGLVVGVWLLGLVTPPREGLTPNYVGAFTALLLGLGTAELTAPNGQASLGRRLGWLVAELALAFLIVRLHGSFVRPTLVYLLPASQALLMFGERHGLLASAMIWVAFGANIVSGMGVDHVGELPNYFSFLLPLYLLAVVLTIGVMRQTEARVRAEQLYVQLQAAHQELQALHQQGKELAVTQERNRLAREIHDSLAHYLTVINLQLEAAQKLGQEQTARALDHVERARRLTVDCLQDVRRSVAALRAPTVDELGLPALLEKLAREFSETTGLSVKVDLASTPSDGLEPDPKLVLFRAAQEGLTNIQRHAHATTATLRLRRQDGFLNLVVEDDGDGPSAATDHGGFGLIGLHERADLVGGHVEFGPAGSRGTRLMVSVPVN